MTLEPADPTSSELLPFEDLDAPAPVTASPPPTARWIAFVGIVLGGLLGGAIGWGTGDVLGGSDTWAALGALVFGVGCAAGVGIVAWLTLQAMNEWNEVRHPEAERESPGPERSA